MRKNTARAKKEFLNRIKEMPIDLLSEFTGTGNKVTIKCHNCGSITSRRADSIKGNSVCTKCKSFNRVLSNKGDHLLIDVSTNNHPDAVMKISNKDWEYIKSLSQGRVSAVRKGGSVYAQIHIKNTVTTIHRLLIPDSKVIDHKNGDGLDNRRSNIRSCTYSQNNMNAKVRSHNTTGVKGVRLCPKTGHYHSSIIVDGVRTNLGTFEKIEDAELAFNNASIRIHGEFAYINNKGEI